MPGKCRYQLSVRVIVKLLSIIQRQSFTAITVSPEKKKFRARLINRHRVPFQLENAFTGTLVTLEYLHV